MLSVGPNRGDSSARCSLINQLVTKGIPLQVLDLRNCVNSSDSKAANSPTNVPRRQLSPHQSSYHLKACEHELDLVFAQYARSTDNILSVVKDLRGYQSPSKRRRVFRGCIDSKSCLLVLPLAGLRGRGGREDD